MKRREFLQHAGGGGLMAALVAAGWWPAAAGAADWNKAAFEGRKLEDVLKALGGVDAKASDDIQINSVEIAENGAVVPIGMVSRKPGTDTLAILVEKNPNLLAAVFSIPDGTLPEVQTRVKMAQTSNVYVLARAGGKFGYAVKEIKVTLGGCGG